MKSHFVESIPAVKRVSDFFTQHNIALPSTIKKDIESVLEGAEKLDQKVKQKEQLLVQKESVINEKTAEVRSKDSLLVQKEREEFIEVLQRLDPSYTDHIGDWPNNIYKDAVVNGNSKLISNSLPILKQSLLTKEFITVLNKINPEIYKTDIVSLNSNQFSFAVSNWPDNIYKQAVIENNLEGIKLIADSLPILKGRYLLRNEFIELLHKLYPESYPEKFEDWSVSRGKELIDNEDYTIINSILPIYRQELKNRFSDKDNLLIKEQEIENLNRLILAEKAKIEELLVEKANEQVKLIYQDHLLSDQTEKIETINILLETKEIIIQRLEQEKEILQTRYDILDMKMQLTVKEFTVREREKDKALLEKDNALKKLAEGSELLAGYKEEMLKFKELYETKEAEIKEKDELLVQKEVEKAVLVDDLQEKLHLKDSEILGLKMMVSEMDLAGDYQLEHLND